MVSLKLLLKVEEAAKEIGGIEVIYTGPAATTAEAQIEVINSLIAQKVDAIAISANDRDALVPIGKKAMDRGITVISWDSGIGEDGRVMNLDPSNTALIGSSNIKWMKNSMGDEGEFAILSATCLLYTSPSPRDGLLSRMPSSA